MSKATKQRQIKLGAFLPGGGQHIAAWRHPDAPADGATNFEFHKQLALTAERGLFDAYFLADNLSVGLGGREGGNAKIVGFEPVTLFAALAPLTKHIGFIATSSTTYEEPYTLARKFASLDLLSNGRAGWNVVTSAGDDTARNFNRDKQPDHADRYARAHEHVETVKALWDSWEDDAFIRDKASGRFYDTGKVHDIDHKGAHFSVKGPLNVPRPVQGHPVVVQAGQSEDGRKLAAASAEVIFTAHQNLASAQEFYRDIKARVRAAGRNPDHVLIMPGVAPFVGRTEEEAREKYQQLTRADPAGGRRRAAQRPGRPDARHPRLSARRAAAAEHRDRGHEEPPGADPPDRRRAQLHDPPALPVDRHRTRPLHGGRQRRAGCRPAGGMVRQRGRRRLQHPAAMAAGRARRFRRSRDPRAAAPRPFRTAYEGRTLRENLGLPRPVNPWTAARALALAAE